MVGYFHDVIGGSENYAKHTQQQTSKRQQQPSIVQSGSSTLLSNVCSSAQSPASEIKEQIEWLHYEHINLLNTSHSAFSGTKCFSNSNLLLVLGYKTGFSVWIIDVI